MLPREGQSHLHFYPAVRITRYISARIADYIAATRSLRRAGTLRWCD
ncbi:hypothetical protein EM595_0619 [Duffyella gerundensis]|jgi:hypothetical protein|uniref:Uncharacterized protein n=1 Tax=Duffyella gerundensis TaxID=1619313 RepID=A0A0U5L0D1_9GAMM|nr:hypothetical protein EM595_0619 [Duffyella gerundensis]